MGSSQEEGSVDYIGLVTAATTLKDAGEIVAQGLIQKLAKSLSVPPGSLDVTKPACVLGVDSLIAVEIWYWFAKNFLIEAPALVSIKNQSLTDLRVDAARKAVEGQKTTS
ncbi:polyketide synthase [Colletotrichum tofieldiae]|nr:polyketide synthase [Colletotrichum tofieldiae]GKT74491.1 polyketide synthase [Colletotrichum tofieldiae]GKT91667.1 polyketide synthase [Colletotrichum tofieldiae]